MPTTKLMSARLLFSSLFGTTTTSAKRYLCRACGKTLSVSANPTARQRLADKNEVIFKLLMNKVPLKRMRELAEVSMDIGKWHDRWLFYPFPDMSEPEKAICYLTDLHDRAYDDDHLAWLYSKATLHGIDRFFMQARRRLSLFERPISSASSERKWYGYSPYNPAIITKILEIFRVFTTMSKSVRTNGRRQSDWGW